jgi:hypothetical protein
VLHGAAVARRCPIISDPPEKATIRSDSGESKKKYVVATTRSDVSDFEKGPNHDRSSPLDGVEARRV